MVYNLYSESIYGNNKNDNEFMNSSSSSSRNRKAKLEIKTESLFANFLIGLIKICLSIYDVISLPIYFILQRPDKRANEAKRIRSERVDTNTWIKTDLNPSSNSYFKNFNQNKEKNESENKKEKKIRKKFMGSTLNDIFANAIKEFKNKPCLGYRAVVTCPVLTLNEEGKHVLQDKSFRSDYTWYTYEQVGRRVQDIASGLYFNSIYPNSTTFFYASTSLEWFLASQACYQLANKLIVAPEISDSNSLMLILKEASINIIFTSCDKLKQLSELFKLIESDNDYLILLNQIKKIILIDWLFSIDYSEPGFAQLRETSQNMMDKLISLGQIEEAGVENPINLSCTKSIQDFDNDYNDNDEQQQQEFMNSNIRIQKWSSQTSIKRFSTYNSKTTAINRKSSPTKNMKPELPHLNNNNNNNSKRNELENSQPISDPPLTVPLQRKVLSISNNNNNDKQNENVVKNYRKPSIALTNVDNSNSIKTTNLLLFKDDNNIDINDNDNKHSFSKNSSTRTSLASDITIVKYLNDKPTKPDDLAMIVYSYGLLGELKAVMLSHNNLSRSNHYLFLDGIVNGQDKHCTTLSLDLVIEFMTEYCIFSNGGSIGYSSNNRTLFYDGKDLFDRDLSDLEALKPTLLLVRSYILEQLRSSIQNYLSLKYNPLKYFILLNIIYDYKKYWARKHFETPIVDKIFNNELKNLFGSKLKFILCNGATDCSETKDFFSFIVNIPVIELYGPDEAIVSLISVNDIWDYKRRKVTNNNKKNFNSNYYNSSYNTCSFDYEEEKDFPNMQLMPPKVDRNLFTRDNSKNLLITSSILCPTLGIRIKLEDWEDFRTSDLPYPRGRMIIGGNDVISKGYFNRETLTKISFYKDSNSINWFRTDDIARVFPNGSFEIISGLSDIIKLEDGQFISLSQIEHILRNSQFVDNCCAICGDDKKFVIALVVPNLRRLALKSPDQANLKMAIGTEPEPEELVDIEFRREVCNDRLLSEFVNQHLNELINNAGFQAIPSRFHLVPEIWTPETELVTPSFEPKRVAIQNFYATDIQSIVKMEFRRSGSRRLSSRLNNSKRVSSGNRLNLYSSNGGRLSY